MRPTATRFAYLLGLLLALLGPSAATYAQTWQWSAYSGGVAGSNKAVNDVATDAAGNTYVIGRYSGTPQFGTTVLPAPGYWGMFVAKLSPTGQWLWATATGSGTFEEGNGIAVDAAGTGVYVGGTLGTGTYTLGSSTFTIPAWCTHGAVFGRLSAATGQWEWAQGGNNGSGVKSVTLGTDGSCAVSGYGKGTDFALGDASVTGSLPEGSVFVARYSATGQALGMRAAAITGGSPMDMAVDAAGNAYVTGYFGGSAQFGTTALASQDGADGYVAKLGAGGTWEWAYRFGGSGYDIATAVKADNSGNAYVGGSFGAESTFGATTFAAAGGEYAAVGKCGPAGWQWAARPTGYGHGARSLALDAAGRLYVLGENNRTGTFGLTSITATTVEAGFLAQLDPATGQWAGAQRLPGVGAWNGGTLSVTPTGVLYVAGTFYGTITLGPASYTSPNGGDLYTGKLTLPSTTQAPSPALGPAGTRVVLRGTRLEAVSEVLLGGLPAAFTIDSPEQLTVTVPAGAPLGAAAFTLTTPDGPLSSAAFTVTTATASAGARPAGPALQAYPNPAHQQLRVVSTAGQPVALFDLLGRACALPPLATHPDGVTLSVAHLPAGLYLLRVGARQCRVRIN